MALWTHPSSKKVAAADEFFGDVTEDDDTDGQRRRLDGQHVRDGLAAKEAAAVEAKHRTLGYHETYEISQEDTLQEGFTMGYTDTFEVAVRIGSLLGRAAAARQSSTAADNISNSDSAYLAATCRILNVLKSASEQQQPSETSSGDEDNDEHDQHDASKAQPTNQMFLDLEREVNSLLNDDSGHRDKSS